jgi:REP element-mobilizing transposase RayT
VYFVTLCVHQKECWLGEVVDGEMVANVAGAIVKHTWEELPRRFPGVGVDMAVVMPNHFHGIILVGAQFIAPSQDGDWVGFGMGAINHAPTGEIISVVGAQFIAPAELGNIVRAFKAVCTRRIRMAGIGEFAWQRNYYERVIRSETELLAVREYIADNPRQWDLDRENPGHP